MRTPYYYARITDTLGRNFATMLYTNILELKRDIAQSTGWFTNQLGEEFYLNPDRIVSVEFIKRD